MNIVSATWGNAAAEENAITVLVIKLTLRSGQWVAMTFRSEVCLPILPNNLANARGEQAQIQREFNRLQGRVEVVRDSRRDFLFAHSIGNRKQRG